MENETELQPPAWLGSMVSARINKECEISRLGQLLYSHYRTPVLALKDFVKKCDVEFQQVF